MTDEPWWKTDEYQWDLAQLALLVAVAGPHGIAAVAVNPNGTTAPGWGLDGKKIAAGRAPGFMENYNAKRFNIRPAVWKYCKKQVPFAYVMRSMRVICIDIDGKNGGFEGAAALDLPVTLAETSKSGNGYHLFYLTDEPWDDVTGYGQYDDHIGIVQGVDIRATGCVFHYPSQRWNKESIAPLPASLAAKLAAKHLTRTAQGNANPRELDEIDMLVATHNLMEELAKPIDAGKRNVTLFAIGSKMYAADVEDWEDKIQVRADEVGMDQVETNKILENIVKYGA